MLKNWLRNSIVITFCFFVISKKTFSQDTAIILNQFIVEGNIVKNTKSSKSMMLLDSITRNTSSNISDILEKNSSVYIKKYGKGQLSTISLRGTGASQTQIYWNGFKINSPTLGQTDLSLLPLYFIQEATVNFGTSSILDGSGGLGGSVELNNRLNWKKDIHFFIGKEFSSFANSISTYGISYGNKRIYSQLKLLHLKGVNNFKFNDISKKNKPLIEQVNNRVNQLGIQYEFAIKLTRKDLLTSAFFYLKSNREIPPIIGGVSNKESQKDNNFRSFVSWKAFRKRYKSELKISLFNEKMNYIDSISSVFSEIKVNTYQASYKMNFQFFDKLNFDFITLESFSEVNSNGFDKIKQRNDLAFYLKVNQTVKKITYDIFVRQEIIDELISPLITGFSLNYRLLKKNKLDFKVNFANNYRSPTLNDLYWNPGGNPDLLPEHGWNGEIGLDSQLKRFKLSIHGFYGEINNWIQWLPSDKSYWTPINLKAVINKGIETSIFYKTKVFKFPFSVNLIYAFTNSKNKKTANKNDNTIGKTLIYVPNHKITGNFILKYKSFLLNYNQIYTSKVFIDATNTIYLPHFFPANVSISKQVNLKELKINFQFQINNLYNEPYQIVANRPVPGINYEFKIKLTK